MKKIAFIGLGKMGSLMATRLLNAGYDLTVWNRTSAKSDALVERGARAADTPEAAVAGTDVIITMLRDPAALERVVFGPGGIGEALGPGQLLLDMSTVGPDEIRSANERLPKEAVLVDAPVRGSLPEAKDGRLVIFVGADPATFEQVKPILSHLGTPTRVGGLGSGAAMKVVVNSTLGAAMAAAGEAIALGQVFGLDRRTVLDVVANSPVGGVIRSKREDIEAGRYPANFKLNLALKDLQLVNEAAAKAGLALKVASASREWLEQAADAGLGDLDYSSVIATITSRDRDATS